DRHWILDDNLTFWAEFRRSDPRRRTRVNPLNALRGIETYTARFTNIGLAGCEYQMFNPPGSQPRPLSLNRRVYSNILIDHRIAPARWRGRYNEDTDLTLQVLT